MDALESPPFPAGSMLGLSRMPPPPPTGSMLGLSRIPPPPPTGSMLGLSRMPPPPPPTGFARDCSDNAAVTRQFARYQAMFSA